MDKYQSFSVCTSEALDYACLNYGVNLTGAQKGTLLEAYRSLPIFDDVARELNVLQEAGFHLYALSNGERQEVDTLLCNADIRGLFSGVVSADDIGVFKPSPAVYEYFLEKTNASRNNTWLVSSNSFDVIGAVSAGLNAAWLQRDQKHVFDPWGIEPSLVIESLLDLHKRISVKGLPAR
jgi:2-haloacid dehalogenase